MVKVTRLKSLRQRKALTQQELADKAGVTRSTVARVEGGEKEPFPTTIRKLADALGVKPEDLGLEFSDLVAPYASTSESPGELRDASLTRLIRGLTAGSLRRQLSASFAELVGDSRLAAHEKLALFDLLQEHPELDVLLDEAVEQIRRVIPEAHVKLELSPDPDYGEEQQLFLGISSDLSESEALLALRRFDQDWWVHEVRRANGLLCIDLNDE